MLTEAGGTEVAGGTEATCTSALLRLFLSSTVTVVGVGLEGGSTGELSVVSRLP